MVDFSLKKTIAECDALFSAAEFASGTHFLQTSFHNRLLPLLSKGCISEEEVISLEKENSRLLIQNVQPAMVSLASNLKALYGQGTNSGGLCRLPKGKEYYLSLLKQNTGSDKSISEIKSLLTRRLSADFDSLKLLMQNSTTKEDLYAMRNLERLFPFSEGDMMLEDLQDKMIGDFPVITFNRFIRLYQIKKVPGDLQDYCAPAFFLPPELDDFYKNSIYLNVDSLTSGIDLYTTLAHEGFPGHLYQTVYHRIQNQTRQVHPVEALFQNNGFVEGWALYVEFMAYDYAADCMGTGNSIEAHKYTTIMQLNCSLQLCLYSLLDLGIHYDDLSYEKTAQMLSAFGITNPATIRSIYEYIVEEPTNYLQYYLGYLEILELKIAARAAWGNQYSDLRFHKFLLDYGPADFTYLKDCLDSPYF